MRESVSSVVGEVDASNANSNETELNVALREEVLFWTMLGLRTAVLAGSKEARPSPIPSPCTQFTRAGIEWRRCHGAACMARSYQEHHRSVRAAP